MLAKEFVNIVPASPDKPIFAIVLPPSCLNCNWGLSFSSLLSVSDSIITIASWLLDPDEMCNKLLANLVIENYKIIESQ